MSAKFKQVIVFDSNGEVMSESTTNVRIKNGGGFVISYTSKMNEFLEKTTQGSYVRLFMYIAHHQGYGTNGVFGFRTTRDYLSKALSVDRKTIFRALEYLQSKFLVNESRICGSLEFMVNPAYVTIGTDRKFREDEWNRRWEAHWKKIHSK